MKRALAIAASLAALMTLAAAPAPENAAVKRTLEEAGLMGVWGVDCEAMASSTGWEQIIVGDDGWVTTIQGGDDSISEYRITEAERTAPNEVRMTFVDVDEEAEYGLGTLLIVYRVEKGRQMTWSSRTANGDVLIADGQFEGSDQKSEWYLRCPKGIPVP